MQFLIRRNIDRKFFDGEGWTDDESQAYRTDRDEAMNIARYLERITAGTVQVVVA